MCHQEELEGRASGRSTVVRTRRGDDLPVSLHDSGPGRPGVVVIPDYFGPSPFYERLAAVLGSVGYTALVTDPFHRLGEAPAGDAGQAFARLSSLGDDEAHADLDDVQAWLRRHTGTGPVGVVGFCAGGTWAMCAAEQPDVAAVSFYGFPQGLPGEVTRHVPIDRVARLRSPLLALWGEEDAAVGAEAIGRYLAVTDSDGAGSDVETVVYPEVGHGFLRGLFDEQDPTSSTANRAWSTTLDFLYRHLASGTPA